MNEDEESSYKSEEKTKEEASKHKKSYYEEQEEIKKSFKETKDEDTGDLFKVKSKSNQEKVSS